MGQRKMHLVYTNNQLNISKDVEKEDCDADQKCTSEYWTCMAEMIPILPAPFIFGPWTRTPYCNESCGTNRFGLELRTCNLVSPNLPANISCQNKTTLRTGNSKCPPGSFNCTGKHSKTYFKREANLMWHCVKVTSSSGQHGVTVTQIAARASRPSGAFKGSQESEVGTGATRSTPKVSSKLRHNLASLTVHQVGEIKVSHL